MEHEAGLRVSFYGTTGILAEERDSDRGEGLQWRVKWDNPLMPHHAWFYYWQLKLLSPLEQLAREA